MNYNKRVSSVIGINGACNFCLDEIYECPLQWSIHNTSAEPYKSMGVMLYRSEGATAGTGARVLYEGWKPGNVTTKKVTLVTG